MNKKTIIFVLTSLLLVVGIISITVYSLKPQTTSAAFASGLYNAGTATSTVCSTSASTMLIASSTDRRFLNIANMSSKPIWLNFGAPAVKYKGMTMMASSTYNFDSGAPYLGAIFCIAEGSDASTTALEIKQLN